MKNIFPTLLLFISFSLIAQEQYLVINPDGHKSSIIEAAIDADQNIITGSFDKTIKIWDSKRGKLIKEFRGKIGPGNEGMIYTIDISPDQKYVAVGGWFGKNDESEALGDVRIYKYETGEIYKVLTGVHTNVVRTVRFTPDSKHLIVADADGFIVKWQFRFKNPILLYKTDLVDIVTMDMGDDYFVSSHVDGNAYKWSFDKEKPVKKSTFFSNPKLNMAISSTISVSENSEQVAIAGKELGMVIICDRKLKIRSSIIVDNCNKIIDVRFSPSGKKLILSIKKGGSDRALIYEKNGKEWELTNTLRFDALINHAEFITENKCVVIGGFANEIRIWDLKKPKNNKSMKGIGQTYYSAALNGSILSYGLVADKAYGEAAYNESFNLFSRRKQPIDTNIHFNYPFYEYNGWSLKNTEFNRKEAYDPNEVLKLYYKGDLKAEVERYYWDGNVHRSFTLVNDSFFVSGGDYGTLRAYDFKGNEVSTFVGHEGAVSSVSVSENGKYLVSASYDNTIRIWPINQIGKENKHMNLMSMYEIINALSLGEAWKEKVRALGLERNIGNEKSVEACQKIIDKFVENGEEVSFLQYYLNTIKANEIKPLVSIFVATNDEWVIWNNDGYFTSSKKGAKFIGYHLNQGKKKAAKFYPFEQFDLKYNRPDIIFNDLGIADESIIDLYYRAYQKRLKRANIKEEDLLNEIHVPELKIKSYQQIDNTVEISINAIDSKFKLKKINVYNNDVPIYGRKGIDIQKENVQEFEAKYTIELMEGENKIQFSVMNEKGTESFKETIYISAEENQQKDLYVVSIGTSKYQNSNFDLKYAAKDAEDVSNMFEDNKLYNTVHNLLLTDERVTKANIYKIKDFLANVKTNDVVILFVAGHGVLDKDYNYYYCTHDIDFNNPTEKGISYAELEQLFDKVKAVRKLLIMDTCHSGEVDKEEVEEIESDNTENGDIIFRSTATTVLRERKGLKQTNETVKEMFNDLNRGTGTTVLSSAGGVEFAMESDKWKNGLFTYCLLNGLQSKKADLNNDGIIHLSELQEYIRGEVSAKSNGKQTPTSRFENISLDYPIW